MANNTHKDITDSTGSTAILEPLRNRDEIIFRSAGPDRVYFGINEAAIAGEGVYLDIDDTWTLTGKKAQAAIHAVCDSGNTCKINLQLD